MTTVTKEEMIALVDDTVNFFAEDPRNRRSYDEQGYCMYQSPSGRCCAIGRMLPESVRQNLLRSDNTAPIRRLKIIHPNLDIWKYHVEFLGSLQHIHDRNDYWSKRGMTRLGRSRVAELKRKVRDGAFA